MDIIPKDILPFVIMAIWLPTTSSKSDDVCLWSTYDATCDVNEVIQIERALYGRMAVGRCIPENVGFMMGCQVDVLSYLDSVCSGRQTCQLRLPQDHPAAEYQPCPRGLESYLQLQYNCTAVHAQASPCDGSPILVTGTTGLLANVITERTSQGSQECPWEVRGSPGQKIRLTLYDYGIWRAKGDDSVVRHPEISDMCHVYARVTEEPTGSSITLCGGEAREKIVYLSETEVLQIALTDPKRSVHSTYFLLRYEIIGCLTYIPPPGAVFERHDKVISVNCPTTGSVWTVVCNGTSWQAEGNVANCTEIHIKKMEEVRSKVVASNTALKEDGLTLSQGLVIAFFLSIAILISVIISVIGIVVLRRRPETAIESTPGYNVKENVPMLNKDQRAQGSLRDRDYTTTAQRHAALAAGTVTHLGRFPPLPLPPTALFSEVGHCTVHGTLSRDRYPRAYNQATQPITDHGSSNEWSNSLRSTRSNGKTKNHFYHELDPEHIHGYNGPPLDHKELDVERFNGNDHVEPLPDVLFASS